MIQLKHDIIADSENNIIERQDFHGHNQSWSGQKAVKVLNKEDFLIALKTKRHIKQRWIGTTLNHADFLKLVEEKGLPLVKIKYSINAMDYCFDLLIDNKTTPASIRAACFIDYEKHVGETSFSKYDIKIDILPEFYSMKSIISYSAEEVEAAFNVQED